MRVSRVCGVLLLVQLVGLILPFVLLKPMATSAFLTDAAGQAARVRTGVLLLIVNCLVTAAIAALAYPRIQRHSAAAALLLLTTAGVLFTIQAVDNAHLMSMLALSEGYQRHQGSPDVFEGSKTLYDVAATSMRTTRKWVHYAALLVIDVWFILLHGALLRFRLVPRPLAALGLAAAVLHFFAIPLPFFLGRPGVMVLGMPVAGSQTALAVWLLWKGFRAQHDPQYPRASDRLA